MRLSPPNRRRLRTTIAIFAFLAASFGAVTVVQAADIVDAAAAGLRDDATLRDVAFLSPEKGYAVGDAGAVLRTTDGGMTWTQVEVSSTATLTGVAFADRDRGLIVGWKLSPYTHRVSAEVLSTADGGETWIRQTNDSKNPTAQAARLLPGFLGVVSGTNELTAFGHVNLHARTGLAPWSGPTLGFRREGLDRRTPIAAATRAEAGAWLFAETDGRLHRLRDGAFEPVVFEGAARPVVRALAEDGPLVVAAGSDGFVAVSSDSGASFRVAEAIPAELRRLVHWKSVAILGPSIWLAGSPGAIIAKSEDAGATWHLGAASDPLPIEKLFFVDRSRGWAVGALGTVRKTIDGGRTWSVVRGEGRAAALATLAVSPSSAPLEPMAKHATVDGYRATTWILADVDDQAAWSGATAGSRLAFASGSCGGGSVENATGRIVPPGALEDPRALLARFGREGVTSEEDVIARLACWARAWRPEAIVIPAPTSLGGSPADEQAYRLALTAIDRAADPRFEYSAMRTLGLQPWTPKRVVAPSPYPEAALQFDGADYVAPARLSLVEFALALRSFVETRPAREWVDGAHYAEIRRNVPGRGGSDLLADISASAGSARRRERPAPDAEKLREHTESLPWRRSFQTLAHPDSTEEGFVVRYEDAVRRTALFDPSAAGAALHSVACLASTRGRDDLADVAWRHLASRDPQGPFAEYAALHLAASAGSDEVQAARKSDAERRDKEREMAATSILPGVQSFGLPKAKSDPNGESVRQDDAEYRDVEIQPGAVAFGPVSKDAAAAIAEAEIGVAPANETESPLSRLDAFNRAAPWALAWSRPQFVAWTIGQTQGGATPSGTNPMQLSASLPPALAAYVAATASGSGDAFVQMTRTSERPFLDGRADEPLWRKAAAYDGPNGERTAILFDDEHLYVAYRSPAAPSSDPGSSNPGRPTRDAALTGRERLTILVDVDGDAVTALRYEVDRSGRCRESIVDEATWNPTWYAAAATEGDHWTVEMAIPRTKEWGASTSGPALSAIGIYRIAPGAGAYDALTGQPAEDASLALKRTLALEGPPIDQPISTAAHPAEDLPPAATPSAAIPSFDEPEGDPEPATPQASAEQRFEEALDAPLRARRLPQAP